MQKIEKAQGQGMTRKDYLLSTQVIIVMTRNDLTQYCYDNN